MLNSNSLQTSSPKVFRLLSQRVSLTDLERICIVYGTVIKLNITETPWVNRDDGASYNPLPARICELLILEGLVTDSNTLISALLSLLDPPHMDLEGIGPNILQDAETSHLMLQGLASKTSDPSPSAQLIILARSLDTVRHLHISSLSKEQQNEKVSVIKARVIPAIKAPQCGRLLKMLQSAINIFERRNRN